MDYLKRQKKEARQYPRGILFVFLFGYYVNLVIAKEVPKKTEVLIIGAGLSGLATGFYLKEAKIPFHILELMPRVGGRVRTVRYERKGMPVIYADSGMEEYWESNPAIRLIQALKLPTRSDVAQSSVVIDGKLFPLGAGGDEFYRRVFNRDELNQLNIFKKKISPLVEEISSRKKLDQSLINLKGISFKGFVVQQKLPKRVSEWIRISLECEIGTDWDRISAIDGLSEMHIFIHHEKAYRVIGGNDLFTETLSSKIKNISLNKRVTRIESQKMGVKVFYLDLETNTNGEVFTNHVVSTIPLFRLFEVQFNPPLSQKKKEAIQSMGWGSYFKVHVFVSEKAERFWAKDGQSMLPILTDSSLGVIYDGNPEQKGTKILSLLIFGDEAERYNLMALSDVGSEIRSNFEKLWPGFSKEILDLEFYRFHPRAVASWPVGRSRFDELSNEIRRAENNIHLSGDFTESSHSDGAFLSAERVFKQIKHSVRPPIN